MSITSTSLPFTETLVAAAPEAAGVFALWQGGGIIYYGRAVTIRGGKASCCANTAARTIRCRCGTIRSGCRPTEARMWWVVLGSNQWPLLCESSALPLS